MSANTRGKLLVWGSLAAVTAGLVWFLSSTEAGRAYNAVLLGVPNVSQRELEELRGKAATYDALMEQVKNGTPPDVVLLTAFHKVERGMTEEQARKAVDGCIGSFAVSSSRTRPPDNIEAEVRLIWRRYGDFAQKNHSCEELNVDLGADGLVTAGGVIYVGNYTLDGESEPQLWKQK